MILDILRASLEELVHRVGAWMFLLHKLPGDSEPGARGREGGQLVGWQVMVAQLGSLSRMGRATVSGLQVLVCRFLEEEQLCVTSCLALSKPFFPSEPPGFFLCKWRC